MYITSINTQTTIFCPTEKFLLHEYFLLYINLITIHATDDITSVNEEVLLQPDSEGSNVPVVDQEPMEHTQTSREGNYVTTRIPHDKSGGLGMRLHLYSGDTTHRLLIGSCGYCCYTGCRSSGSTHDVRMPKSSPSYMYWYIVYISRMGKESPHLL